ncbi:hypothetical protein ILFOPFJJ_02626 [Ensifer psoraleae]|uniref:hypothetical protein n=1 Tax=Sinorhizobium psoraleae TaxID=520838 RepID=UPI001567D230|nr:hypothetical protein [Sinorhizobium psoraleae]NRP71736.1 hypothetical protein [Sinorhizobium psoraleae]
MQRELCTRSTGMSWRQMFSSCGQHSRQQNEKGRKPMKWYIGSFGYQFRLVEFMIRSSLAVSLGIIAYVTFYGVFW